MGILTPLTSNSTAVGHPGRAAQNNRLRCSTAGEIEFHKVYRFQVYFIHHSFETFVLVLIRSCRERAILVSTSLGVEYVMMLVSVTHVGSSFVITEIGWRFLNKHSPFPGWKNLDIHLDMNQCCAFVAYCFTKGPLSPCVYV